MLLNAFIVEDEDLNIQNLMLLLSENCPDVIVRGFAKTADMAKHQIKEIKPDLVFLDVELAGGKNGFDMLADMEDIFFKVIFITAFDNHAIKAIKFSAIDYLLKPLDEKELAASVDKVRKSNISGSNQQFKALLHNLEPSQYDKKIGISNNHELLFVNISDIMYLKADGAYTEVHMKSAKKQISTKNISDFESILPGSHFSRIHSACIININYCKKYVGGRGGTVIMDDGSSHDVAIRRKNDFFSKIKF